MWMLCARTHGFRLWIPVPVHVVRDLAESVSDLLALFPRSAGAGVWTALLTELVESLSTVREPLFAIETGDAAVSLARIAPGGE